MENKKKESKKRQAQKDATHFKAQEVIELIEKGQSLRNALIVKYVDYKPVARMSSSSFFKWLERESENAKQYARACELRSDLLFDEILEIADDSSRDTIEVRDKSGKLVKMEDKEWVNRSKLRVDARKFYISKVNPKKYGEKIEVEQKGEVTINFKS
jgi:tRNA splicing endonuclease